MISITLLYREGQPIGFHSSGHADYAAYGSDIVCSAVSVLIINTMNSIESLTDAKFSQSVVPADGEEENGEIHGVEYQLLEATPEAVLLMKSLVLGLAQIREEYEEFISVAVEEV